MSPRLDPGVEDIIESPREGLEVHLIIEVRDEANQGILQTLRDLDASVETLPRNHLSVTTTEEAVQDICELEGVSSIEIDSEVTTLSSRDFLTRLG